MKHYKSMIPLPHYVKVGRQQGSSLLFLLILLLGVAMLAALANRSAILENLVSRANRDNLIAYQAAESALADVVGALGNNKKYEDYFKINAKAPLLMQKGGCPTGGSEAPAKGNLDSDTPIPGLIDFGACKQFKKAWWQEIDLSTFEKISVEINAITKENNFVASNAVPSGAVKKPRFIIEPIPYRVAGGNAATGKGSSNDSATLAKAYRITTLGYGSSTNSVVMLQETWRTTD